MDCLAHIFVYYSSDKKIDQLSNDNYDELDNTIDYDLIELGESYDDYYDELSYVDTDC